MCTIYTAGPTYDNSSALPSCTQGEKKKSLLLPLPVPGIVVQLGGSTLHGVKQVASLFVWIMVGDLVQQQMQWPVHLPSDDGNAACNMTLIILPRKLMTLEVVVLPVTMRLFHLQSVMLYVSSWVHPCCSCLSLEQHRCSCLNQN